jgi:hypothetical protein
MATNSIGKSLYAAPLGIEEDMDMASPIEIEIEDVTYFATGEENGNIYEIDSAGDPGKKVGYIKDGEPIFFQV